MTDQGLTCQQVLSLEPVNTKATDGCGSSHCPQLMMAPEYAQITAPYHSDLSQRLSARMSSVLGTHREIWQPVDDKQTVRNQLHNLWIHGHHFDDTVHTAGPTPIIQRDLQGSVGSHMSRHRLTFPVRFYDRHDMTNNK